MSSDLCVFDDFSFSPFVDSPIDFFQDPTFEEPEDETSSFYQIAPNKFENLSISPKPNSQYDLSFDTQFSDFSNFEAKTQNSATDSVFGNRGEEMRTRISPTKFEKISFSPEPISQNDFNFKTQFSDFSNFEAKTQNSPTDPVFGNREEELRNQITPTKFENFSFSSKPNSQKDLNFDTQFSDFSNLEVKTQNFQIPVNSVLGCESFGPHSYGGDENVERFMQRSYSSNNFNGKQSFVFRQNFDFVTRNQNFNNQIICSQENSFGSGQMRRVCSTGDLQVTKVQGLCSSNSPLGVESSFLEETNFKVGRYSAQERKERIHRYRAKRNQRNFNKTIKYACRKTLADNRPRIRGRFARNDETMETPKAANFTSFEDEHESWGNGYNEEERTAREGTVFNLLGPTQFQYYGYS